MHGTQPNVPSASRVSAAGIPPRAPPHPLAPPLCHMQWFGTTWRPGRPPWPRPAPRALQSATAARGAAIGGGAGVGCLRRGAYACSAALSSTPLPSRGSTSTAPVTLLRRKSRFGTPLNSSALTVRGSSPGVSTTAFVPAVT